MFAHCGYVRVVNACECMDVPCVHMWVDGYACNTCDFVCTTAGKQHVIPVQ